MAELRLFPLVEQPFTLPIFVLFGNEDITAIEVFGTRGVLDEGSSSIPTIAGYITFRVMNTLDDTSQLADTDFASPAP